MIDFKRKKNNNAKRRLILIGLIFILIGFIYYFTNLNSANSNNSAVKEFVVSSGQGSTQISHQLKDQGLIKSPLVFQFYTWRKGVSSKLQAGEYFLAENLNIKQIAQILSRGAGVTKEKTLTFIEGWSNAQYADYLSKQGLGSPSDFLAIIQKKESWWNDYSVLNSRPLDRDLEGYLFPDTYRIYSDASLEDIVKKMLSNLENKITPELKSEIKKQGKTIHEVLTLAAVLEKEVSTDVDRKIVADIFYKRIDAGMALQADSTVNYATGKSNPRASSKDLEIDSLYNTYKYRGLPPGPICNLSISAIIAAIYPTANPYWYFLTTPSGEVIYSKTFEEHVAAKRKYY